MESLRGGTRRWHFRRLPTLYARCCPIINSSSVAESPAQNENSDRQIPGISSRREEFFSPYDFQLRQGPRPIRRLSIAARSRAACSNRRHAQHHPRIRRPFARPRPSEKLHSSQTRRPSLLLQILRSRRPPEGKSRAPRAHSQAPQTHPFRALRRRDERLPGSTCGDGAF